MTSRSMVFRYARRQTGLAGPVWIAEGEFPVAAGARPVPLDERVKLKIAPAEQFLCRENDTLNVVPDELFGRALTSSTLVRRDDLEAACLQRWGVELAAVCRARRDHDHAAAERVVAAGVDGHAWLELVLSRRGERWQGARSGRGARFPPWS